MFDVEVTVAHVASFGRYVLIGGDALQRALRNVRGVVEVSVDLGDRYVVMLARVVEIRGRLYLYPLGDGQRLMRLLHSGSKKRPKLVYIVRITPVS